jgi:hypothetical protein
MTRASSELFQAVDGLRQAVEAEFTGNGYYLAASQITELRELLGEDAGPVASANGNRSSFARSLDAVRKRADAELLDNRYYLVAHKLDVLAFLETRYAKSGEGDNITAPLPAAPAVSAAVAQNGTRTFDALASLAKARVDQSARVLGASGHQPSAPNPAAQPEVIADGELERRSSEPCAMAELAPLSMETMAAARLSPGVAAPPGNFDISPDLGSPASALPVGGTGRDSGGDAAQEKGGAGPLHSAKATHDSKTASTQQTIAAGSGPDKPTTPQRKSLLRRWLDMIFGGHA